MEGDNKSSKILVCIRKRPLTRRDLAAGDKDIIEVWNGNEIYVWEMKLFYLDLS